MRVEAQGTRSPSVAPIRRAKARRAVELEAEDLASSRDLLQTTLDSLPANIAVLDERGEIILTNRAWRVFALANGAAAPAGVGANYLAVCDAVEDDRLVAGVGVGLRAIIAGTSSEFTAEYPCHGPLCERWFSLRATRYEGAGPARAVVLHDDITMRRKAQAEVAIQAALLDEIDASVIATDPDGLVTHWSRGAEQLYGWTRAEALGRGIELIVSSGAGFAEVIAELHREGRWEGRWEGRLAVARKDGSEFPALVRVRRIEGDAQRPAGMVGVSVDMTEQVESQQSLVAAKNYMSAVADSMGEGLYTLDPEGTLLYMNRAAQGLLGWTSEELLGRVVHDVAHSRRADGTVNPIEDCQIRGAQRDGLTVSVEDDVFTCRDGRLLPVSYTATPFVTADGVEGCAVVFEDITDRKAREQSLERDVETLSWVARVQDALEQDLFVLYAQPIIDLRSGEVIQRELLLRMRDGAGEIIAPGAFLPIAEEYGLIGDIDRWVIEHAIAIAATGLSVQLNLSACSVGDPAVLGHIERCLMRADADPGRLIFEITETALLDGEANAKAFADRLHRLGCGVALDDFGTGYGGLTYLKQLPVDFLKIDIEFVRDITTSSASRHVVEAVVALAIAFDLQTVGEGVEDAETLELLRDLGVDFAQGYHIARPGPLDT